MKVLHLLSSSRYSGAENVACQIIDMMKDIDGLQGVYCSPDGEIRETLKKKKIEYKGLKKYTICEIKKVIKEERPDIIHAHDMKASFIASLVCKDIPLISHIHNNNFDSRKVSLKSLLYYFAAKKAKRIIWVSNDAYEGYRFHNKFKEKSIVLYNVIDTEKIKARVDVDKKNYDYEIVYLGRITYPKNPERLLKVLKRLLEIRPRTKIAVIGTGDLEDKIIKIAKDDPLLKNITFLGFLDNPYKILSNAKVMIMTSRWEGTPMCVLESLALGTPIISTPVDGIKDLIINDYNGYLLEENEEIVFKLYEILDNEEKLKEMSLNCKIGIKKIADLETYKRKIHEIYYSYLKKEK